MSRVGIQGDHGGEGLGFVGLASVFPPSANFARAAANWAEVAEQLDKIVELQK